MTCFGCGERKERSCFPVGDGSHSQTGRTRRRPYCQACLDAIAEEKRLQANERAATWKNYRGVIVRRCSKCKVVKPLTGDFFYVGDSRKEPTQPTYWSYRCKKCSVERSNAYARDKRLQRDDHFYERRRAAQRKWVEANPEKALECSLRYRERKEAGLVVPMAERRRHDASHPRIKRGPFLDWIERKLREYELPELVFCELIGMSPRSLLRLRENAGELVELDTVDRALQLEGSTLLQDLYPNLYEEAA